MATMKLILEKVRGAAKPKTVSDTSAGAAILKKTQASSAVLSRLRFLRRTPSLLTVPAIRKPLRAELHRSNLRLKLQPQSSIRKSFRRDLLSLQAA